jgi:hypothetical protein
VWNLVLIQCITNFGQGIAVASLIQIFISFQDDFKIATSVKFILIVVFFTYSQIASTYNHNNDKHLKSNNINFLQFLSLGFCIFALLSAIVNLENSFLIKNICFFKSTTNSSNLNIFNQKEFSINYSSISLTLFFIAKFMIELILQTAVHNIQINIFLNVLIHVLFVVSISILSQIMIQNVIADLNVIILV